MGEEIKDWLDAIHARLENATPGPWRVRIDFVEADKCKPHHICNIEILGEDVGPDDDIMYPRREQDLEFIANCPTDVRKLVHEVKRLRQVIWNDEYATPLIEMKNKEIDKLKKDLACCQESEADLAEQLKIIDEAGDDE